MKLMLAWVAAGLISAGCRAESVGQMAKLTLIDRGTGIALPITRYRGEYWVAGTPGMRYALEFTNRGPTRVMAVISVDGVNILSGATAAWNQGGYVFEAAENYQIAGWRKTDQQVAAFVFSGSPDSYAQRTGRPANLGVIGGAIFNERQSALKKSQERAADANESSTAAAERNTSAPILKLGTSHGEREDSYVRPVEFVRSQSIPDEIITIHYDITENLIAMGIIARPRWLPQHADPFPGSPGSSYTPDPPG